MASAPRHAKLSFLFFSFLADRSHSNYNGAQVTGVEKREIKIKDPDRDPEASGGSRR
jgi:hypothetical protein